MPLARSARCWLSRTTTAQPDDCTAGRLRSRTLAASGSRNPVGCPTNLFGCLTTVCEGSRMPPRLFPPQSSPSSRTCRQEVTASRSPAGDGRGSARPSCISPRISHSRRAARRSQARGTHRRETRLPTPSPHSLAAGVDHRSATPILPGPNGNHRRGYEEDAHSPPPSLRGEDARGEVAPARTFECRGLPCSVPGGHDPAPSSFWRAHSFSRGTDRILKPTASEDGQLHAVSAHRALRRHPRHQLGPAGLGHARRHPALHGHARGAHASLRMGRRIRPGLHGQCDGPLSTWRREPEADTSALALHYRAQLPLYLVGQRGHPGRQARRHPPRRV